MLLQIRICLITSWTRQEKKPYNILHQQNEEILNFKYWNSKKIGILLINYYWFMILRIGYSLLHISFQFIILLLKIFTVQVDSNSFIFFFLWFNSIGPVRLPNTKRKRKEKIRYIPDSWLQISVETNNQPKQSLKQEQTFLLTHLSVLLPNLGDFCF